MSVNWADFKPIADANAPATSEGLPASIGENSSRSAMPRQPWLTTQRAASGVNQLVSGVGYLAERSGATNVGKYIRDIGDTGQRYWSDSMTPAGRRAAGRRNHLRMTRTRSSRALESVHYRPWPWGLPSLPVDVCCAVPGGIAAPDCAAWPGWQLLEESAGRLLRLPLAQPRQLADGGELRRQSGRQGPVSAGLRRSRGAIAGASNAAQWKSDIEQKAAG